MLRLLVLICLAYLLGSANTAIWLTHLLRGMDIRQLGDGNAGATNVFRNVSPLWGITVGVADVSKTWVMLWVANHKGLIGVYLALVGASVVAGHVYPVFFGFRGGTGLATSLGGLLYFDPVMTVGVFLLAMFLTILWERVGFTIHKAFDSLASAETIAFVLAIAYTVLWGKSEVKAFLLLCTIIIAYRRRQEARFLVGRLIRR